MKKVLLSVVSFLFVCTLLLGSFGSAKAAAGDDPTVTPVSGDMEFTTEIVPIVNLPGVTELANHMLAPIGFPAGEAQFGGNGIRVSKMDSGKATVCFSLSTVAVQQGWGGKVGVWNGTKWVKLATTIATSTDEAATTLACATITGNGTYAFIKYVADATLLPNSKPACGFTILNAAGWGTNIFFGDDYMSGDLIGFEIQSTTDLSGMPVTVSLIRSVPTGAYVWDGTGSGIFYSEGEDWYYVGFSPAFGFYVNNMLTQHTYHLDFGYCTQDFTQIPQIPD